jgi:outer membrane receptor for Fe3+-dicitrate
MNGNEIVEDVPHFGRSCMSKSEENMTKVMAVMRNDRRFTVTMISNKLNLSHQTAQDILTKELGMRTQTLHHDYTPSRSRHTRLISIHMTSYFSRNSNSTSKIVIL